MFRIDHEYTPRTRVIQVRASGRRPLFAFPAIFPASATLVEKHEREKKEKAGLKRARRGKEAAALEAAGAVVGSLGLVAFAAVIALLMAQALAPALVASAALWAVVAVSGRFARRLLRGG